MRKRATDLLREADEIRKKAHDLRKLEKKRERTEGRLRVALLGALLERRLASDAAERTRVNIELRGFLKSPEHRELFHIDAVSTYVDELPDRHAAKRAKREDKAAGRAHGKAGPAGDAVAQGLPAAASKGRSAGEASISSPEGVRGSESETARAGARGDVKLPSQGADSSRMPASGRDPAAARSGAASPMARSAEASSTNHVGGGAS